MGTMDDTHGNDDVRGNDEPINDFDETNGIVEGLDGDDGGALDPEGRQQSVLGEAVKKLTDPADQETDDEDGETSYSEEGRP